MYIVEQDVTVKSKSDVRSKHLRLNKNVMKKKSDPFHLLLLNILYSITEECHLDFEISLTKIVSFYYIRTEYESNYCCFETCFFMHAFIRLIS